MIGTQCSLFREQSLTFQQVQAVVADFRIALEKVFRCRTELQDLIHYMSGHCCGALITARRSRYYSVASPATVVSSHGSPSQQFWKVR
jgi:hypothetical protein